VALKLKELGFEDAYALTGGWKKWESLGYPTEKK
jgi:rhodanese-related sulfurtransferase